MSEYNDYGWSEGQTCAHDYLYPGLLSNKYKIILDVGCGNGTIENKLINLGFNVYGIDASKTGIEIAKKENNDKFFIQDIESNELPKEIRGVVFDIIIFTEVIKHLYNPRTYINFFQQMLINNGGGELIISCSYHGYFKNLILVLLGKMDSHFTVLWDGRHIKFWSKNTLTQLLDELGFEVIKFKGSGRFPFLWKNMFIKAKVY